MLTLKPEGFRQFAANQLFPEEVPVDSLRLSAIRLVSWVVSPEGTKSIADVREFDVRHFSRRSLLGRAKVMKLDGDLLTCEVLCVDKDVPDPEQYGYAKVDLSHVTDARKEG